MTDKHQRLRKARVDAGFRHASEAAASIGVTPSTYRAHENGQNDYGLDEAERYSKKFGVSQIWLLTGKTENTVARSLGSDNIATQSPPNAKIGQSVLSTGKLLPVYGQAVAGVQGEFAMNGNVLFELMCPPTLSEVTGAYAVLISGDSMSPRYEDGEVAFIDPTRRVRRGDYVVAQIRVEEDGPPLAYVKKFVRWNSEELVLEQFNPPVELRFASSSVESVHYIALAGNS